MIIRTHDQGHMPLRVSETATVDLSRDEVVILTDRVQNTDVGTENMPVSTYLLLLKLGSAYVDQTEQGVATHELPVVLTEPELWLLRSKVTSGDKTASDALFGVKLLRKIYTALLVLNGGMLDLEAIEHSEHGGYALKRMLTEWKEADDEQKRQSESREDDTSDGAVDGTIEENGAVAAKDAPTCDATELREQ